MPDATILHLEALEDRTAPALFAHGLAQGDRRRVEAVLRRAMAPPPSLVAPPTMSLPGLVRGTASGGRGSGLPSPPASVRLALSDEHIWASFMLYDPRIQSAFSAVTLNHLTDRWAEIEGRGARFKETGRFITLAPRPRPAPRPPCPDGIRAEDFDLADGATATAADDVPSPPAVGE